MALNLEYEVNCFFFYSEEIKPSAPLMVRSAPAMISNFATLLLSVYTALLIESVMKHLIEVSLLPMQSCVVFIIYSLENNN